MTERRTDSAGASGAANSVFVEGLLHRGVASHRLGKIDEAKTFYERVLSYQRANFDALQLLALANSTQGNYVAALKFYTEAASCNPSNANIHHNIANLLAELGKLEEAVFSYETSLALEPENCEVLKNKGITLQDLGRFDEAVSTYRKVLAIDPTETESLNNLGVVYTIQNSFDDALQALSQAIVLNPAYSEAHYNRANAYSAISQHERALTDYKNAILLNSSFAQAHKKQGDTLLELHRLQEALDSYTLAIGQGLETCQLYNNRSVVLSKLAKFDEAVSSARKALELDSSYVEAWSNLGFALRHQNQYREAVSSYRSALDLNPEHLESNYNLGSLLYTLGEGREARRYYDRALSADPAHPLANWNKSLLLLLLGDYLEGWALYEWRLKSDDAGSKYPSFSEPAWRGDEDIQGKRLLIHAEQGLGDMLQFCRYAPLVLERGAEVILEVPRPLVSVIETLHPDISVVIKGEQLPEFDFHCPVMSLPYAFKTTLATIPSAEKYLSSDAAKVAVWSKKLGEKTGKRVGLVWSGAPGHQNDHNRSIALSDLTPLLDMPCEWHSLQKDYRSTDIDTLATLPQLHQHQDALTDFSDTAALIECMDLVITVDTSVAHLAGALGKPVWVLLPHVPDFRWLLERTDSPWYPSARLFRQSEIGQWESLIREVRSRV